MIQDDLKKVTAEATLKKIIPFFENSMVIGIGTGSTVNFFIDALSVYKNDFDGCVASSNASAQRLKSHGIAVYDLNSVNKLRFYVDGADEVNDNLQLIKGGGAALTREKIIAAVADEFICIADESKVVNVLGEFPLPVEVIPMARSHVGRELVKLGGDPSYRERVVTDNGNIILDVWNLNIINPEAMEASINQITGVVTNGIFALRPADVMLVGRNRNGKTVEEVLRR